MKYISAGAGGVVGLINSSLVHAQQAAMETATRTQFDNLAQFIVNVITGPVAKIIALVLLLVGIWCIINKDYGTAIGCVIALLALVFLPQILGVFGK